VAELIARGAEKIEGVRDIHDIKIRSYGPRYIVDLKIAVDGKLTVKEGHSIAVEVKNIILTNQTDVKDVLVHVDPDCVEKED